MMQDEQVVGPEHVEQTRVTIRLGRERRIGALEVLAERAEGEPALRGVAGEQRDRLHDEAWLVLDRGLGRPWFLGVGLCGWARLFP